MSNKHAPVGERIRFRMDDFDNLPKAKRELLANAPSSFGISNSRRNIEDLQARITSHMHKLTLRDYGPDHPEVNRDYYPKMVRGVQLNKLNISL